jgi:hypothetical protein
MFRKISGKISPLIILAIIAVMLFLLTGCGCGSKKSLTVLSIADGSVVVTHAGTQDAVEVKVGMSLQTGDVIQTGSDSSATITFFEGSIIELEAGTQIEIASLDIAKSGKTTILVKQKIGETISRLTRLADPASLYQIETVAAMATVRGSIMVVVVEESGRTTVGNQEGKISIIAQGVEVEIPVNEHSVAEPGQPPSAPVPGIKPPPEPVVTPAKLSTPVMIDAEGDLFDANGIGAAGEGYLDILSSQVSLENNLYTVYLELKDHCPVEADNSTAFIEWDILIDSDIDNGTGTKWPLIANDIGYDYMARATLEGSEYGQGLLDVRAKKWSDIESIVAVYNSQKVGNIVELYFPADAIGSPDRFNFIIAVRKYLTGDAPNKPSVSDKTPDSGHYPFP